MGDGGRLTWFPFNPGDWLADDRVAVMGWKLEGAYLHLLARSWVRGQGGGECSIPDDDAYIGGVLRASPEEVAEIRARLIEGPMAVFQKVNGMLVNKRLLREFEAAKALVETASDAGRRGAARRWTGGQRPAKRAPQRRKRGVHGDPMLTPSPPNGEPMPTCQGFDGNLQVQVQEQVPVQEESEVVVSPKARSDSTVGAPKRADDGDGPRSSQSARSTKLGTRVPDPLDLDAACAPGGATFRSEAIRLGISPARVQELRDEFVDYWRGVPGQRGRKTDWLGTWRNRCRDAPARYRATGGDNARRFMSAADQSEANFDAVLEVRHGTR